jgi:hypothetical protein
MKMCIFNGQFLVLISMQTHHRLTRHCENRACRRRRSWAVRSSALQASTHCLSAGPVVSHLARLDGELRRRAAAQTAILYAFDLIEHDGEDLHDRPFLERKAELALALRDTKAGILLNEHIAEDGPTVRSRRRRNRSDQ